MEGEIFGNVCEWSSPSSSSSHLSDETRKMRPSRAGWSHLEESVGERL